MILVHVKTTVTAVICPGNVPINIINLVIVGFPHVLILNSQKKF